MENFIDGVVDEELTSAVDMFIEEQNTKIMELTQENLTLRTRSKFLEKELNESIVPLSAKRKLYDAKVENEQLVNEIHALKTEIYELRKLIPEGILINRESRDKPARTGRQLR